MKPCQPGGRRQPPPVVVTRGFPAGPSGFDWGQHIPIYPDVAWTPNPLPPIPSRVEPPQPPQPPTVVTIATDGSVGSAPGVGNKAGWAWVSEFGRADAGAISAGDARVAELFAIAKACASDDYAGRPLHILCDSQAAVRVVKNIIARQAVTGVSLKTAGAIRKRVKTTGLTIEWVKGHNGLLLNEIADRLALMARRRCQADLGDVREMAQEIAARELRGAA